MLTSQLFQKVLIDPAEQGYADRLQIVSGFATASMADRHIEQLNDLGLKVSIDLVVGMSPLVGIERVQHFAFQKLANQGAYGMRIGCRYIPKGYKPVHAKVYCWYKDGVPIQAFLGSANYTLTGFGKTQMEAVEEIDSNLASQFNGQILKETVNCLDQKIDQLVGFTETKRIKVGGRSKNSVELSLLTKDGETPNRSGINWGQRPGREKDQACINISADIRRSEFFPDRGERFTVLTDDHTSFIMVRAQDGGKGLHTTENNSILGKYLRQRMQLPMGTYVTKKHLVDYGRTTVTFTKIDDETYHMDFGTNMEVSESAEIWQG